MERISYSFLIAIIVSSCVKNETIDYLPIPDNDHLLLGNPSNAQTIPDSANNYLLIKTYYALSYNDARGTPNWVSWHLYAGDMGSTERSNNFKTDTSLPPAFFRIDGNNYAGSGFDRGHHCSSGDRTVNTTANGATFLMSNIIPQAPSHNQVIWARMEDSIRTYVRGNKEAFIQMGSYGMGGTGDSGYAYSIHNGHIIVPAYIWKLAVLIPNGNDDLRRINSNARVIAVIIPNSNTAKSDWKRYRTNVQAIQDATGYLLLTNIPASIRKTLLKKIDDQ